MDQIENDKTKEFGFVGYASKYLQECWDESKLENQADVTVVGIKSDS